MRSHTLIPLCLALFLFACGSERAPPFEPNATAQGMDDDDSMSGGPHVDPVYVGDGDGDGDGFIEPIFPGGSGGSGAGGSGAGGAVTGGANSGGSASGGASAGGSGGVIVTGPEWPDHPVYIYAERSAGSVSTRACDVETGDSVGDHSVPYSQIVHQIHPITYELWTEFSGTGEWNAIADHPDVCSGLVDDFAFHPGTGDLASQCGGIWYDNEGNVLGIPYKYRDIEGLILDDGKLYDTSEDEITLSGETLPWDEVTAVHSRSSGGFWVLTYGSGQPTRWTVAPDGAVSLDGSASTGFTTHIDTPGTMALDALGGIYAQGIADGVRSMIRIRSDFTRSEEVYRLGDCSIAQTWARLITTP